MYDIFQLKPFQFPEGFLLGSATAAHQIEGNNIHSINWEDEQKLEPGNPYSEASGMACNHYNMYREDADMIAQLGHRAFRLGVEWARIEPEEGHFDQKEADHYISELSLLKEKGIQVFVTLVHFSVPAWFAHKGGFTSADNIKYFERYLDFILPQISQYVDYWNVLNEFNGVSGPEDADRKFTTFLFHAHGYHMVKKYSNKPVSSAHALIQFFGKRQNDIFDLTMQHYQDISINEFFFHAIRTGELVIPFHDVLYDKSIKDTCDFWSINLYTRSMVDTRKKSMAGRRYDHKHMRMVDMGFYLDEIFPECMYHNLTRLLDKPVIITENGCSCDDDRFRIVYIAQYLSALHEAMEAGVDVRGYLYWSLMDNYEWGSYIPRFGLVDVDRKNGFTRTPKPSAYFYRDIINQNGFTQEILRKYLHEMPTLPDGANK